MARRPSEDDIRRIYRDTMDDLYGFVSRRCDGERELAEDVTQETWLRAVKSWPVDGVPDVPIAWLKTVASRLLINLRRRQAPDQLDEEVEGRVEATADETVERRSLVARAMARLPALQARLLEAFHYDRRPVTEIASTFGISERGVEGRLRRARQKLRTEIEEDPDARGEIT